MIPAPSPSPIGIFDSGYGGLTVFRAIADELPRYDYLYLGDNARAPYGNRSFEAIRQYTWECVQHLFARGCPLVILACNTASARALRAIQQEELTAWPGRRVLGVIRPTAEVLGRYSSTNKIGILGTAGTVRSGSYVLESAKFFPGITVYQQACPMLVPLIENGAAGTEGARFFVRQYVHDLLAQCPGIDVVLLACTHYPLLESSIREALPPGITLLSQGNIVAASLKSYLLRHPEMETSLSANSHRQFLTTDSATDFDQHAAQFFGQRVQALQIHAGA